MITSYSEKEKQILAEAERLKDISYKYGISYCFREDKNYPSSLKQIANMPPLIYYKGNIEIINNNRNLAIIGSRQFSANGKNISFNTGKLASEAGLNVVNGLALGCDTEALKGALSANGKCIAILPCGLDDVQPKTNRKLAEEILEKGGCLLSEYPVGSRIQKYMYVERDRLQSGISQGVIIIEAEKESGTMHTAKYAINQYKRLACYYHKMLEMSSGNKYLEDIGKAEILKSDHDLQIFLQTIVKENDYEQLTFDF